ncbi:FAD-dependent oxidoreductase [Streptomyces albus subsp. albus]|nr:FAD-dependent oxidoreductase [Streptomyces albus subsp. albus]
MSTATATQPLTGLRVLISGASIGGPTLAYWLDRYGCAVTVVERAPALRPGGQAIDVRGAALEVAERMGVLERIRRHGTALRGMSVVDDDGRELFRTTERTVSGGALDSPDVEILRDDLADILYAAGGRRIEYLFGDSIGTLVQSEDEVRVLFRGGTSRAFDLVVGADGVHSDTRRLVFGPERDHLRHLGGYLGVWTMPNRLGLDRWQVVHRTAGRRLWGAMVMSVRDNTQIRVHTGITTDEPPERFLPRDTEERKRLLVREYAGAGWEMPRLIHGIWDAPDFHFDSLSQIHLDSWSRGRVVLLGDAAYCGSPASGQGTTMAMVGAYVLAGELAAAAGEHLAGLAAYERKLRPFTTANQQLAQIHVEQRRRERQANRVEPTDIGEVADYQALSAFPLEDY